MTAKGRKIFSERIILVFICLEKIFDFDCDQSWQSTIISFRVFYQKIDCKGLVAEMAEELTSGSGRGDRELRLTKKIDYERLPLGLDESEERVSTDSSIDVLPPDQLQDPDEEKKLLQQEMVALEEKEVQWKKSLELAWMRKKVQEKRKAVPKVRGREFHIDTVSSKIAFFSTALEFIFSTALEFIFT